MKKEQIQKKYPRYYFSRYFRIFLFIIPLIVIISSCLNEKSPKGWEITFQPESIKCGFRIPLKLNVIIGAKKKNSENSLRLRFPHDILGRPYEYKASQAALKTISKIFAPTNCMPQLNLEGRIEQTGPFDLLMTFPPSCLTGDKISIDFYLPPFYREGAIKIEAQLETGVRIFPLKDFVIHSSRLKPGPADGKGEFPIDRGAEIIAGREASWSIIYTAGENGIEKNGAISVIAPHALYSSRHPTIIPGLTDNLDNVSVIAPKNAKIQVLTKFRAFHRTLDIVVKDGRINQGDEIKINFKKSVFYISGKWPFGVWVDGDGDGSFSPVISESSLQIEPEAAYEQKQIIMQPNKEHPRASFMDVYIDKFGNPSSHSIGVSKRDVPYPSWLSTEKSENSWKLNFIAADKLSYSTTVPNDADQPQIFWGDLHGHSSMSDGAESPSDYFSFARNVAIIDFAALTDHERQLTENEWKEILDAADKYTEPGTFAAIAGIEINDTAAAHTNLIFENRTELPSPVFGETDDVYSTDYNGNYLFLRFPMPALIKSFLKNDGALAIAHRAGMHEPIFQIDSPPEQPVIEMYSAHGSAEEKGKPWSIQMVDSDETVLDVLRKGSRVGFTASGDSHDGRPGMTLWNQLPGGLTAVKCEALHKKDIFDALRKRRTWATTGSRGYLDFRIDEHPEGSEIDTSDHELKLRCIVMMPEVEDVVIRRFADGKWTDLSVPQVEGYPIKMFDKELILSEKAGNYIYYVRVMGKNFPLAWSSPIWVKIK